MSNHVHLLLDFSVQVPEDWDGLSEIPGYKNVSDAMKLIKGGISYSVNKILGRTGSIWSYGYYDRLIRSAKHFEQAFFYILNNPVKAGLVEKWEDHPYTFVKNRDETTE
jgi:REP element-mobilizing transposase RayT